MQSSVSADPALNAGINLSLCDDGMCSVVMDRPDQRNAMSPAGVDRLMYLLDYLERNSDCRCIILSGAGRGFCSGSDLKLLSRMSTPDRLRFESDCGRLSRMIARLSRPVVAAVHGFAIGGGLTLAASCDIVVTSPDARWSLPEVHIGLFPAWGLSFVVRRCGNVTARRLSWGIDTLDGKGALAAGLADEIADDPLEVAMLLGRKLAALPQGHSACVKEFFSVEWNAEDADHVANRLFLRMTGSPEASATFSKSRSTFLD